MNVLHESSGVIVRRVVDLSDARVPEHAHDWPVLSIFVLGGYLNQTELGRRLIDGPSAVLYRAGSAHRNTASPLGFEQIEIEFDPAWLGRIPVPARRFPTGSAGTGASWRAPWPNTARVPSARPGFGLRCANSCGRFGAPTGGHTLHGSMLSPSASAKTHHSECTSSRGRWDDILHGWGRPTDMPRARDYSRRLPAFASNVRRGSCARAIKPMRDVALEAGFCDQSHMNRSFRRLLRRLPTAVRQDQYRVRTAVPG